MKNFFLIPNNISYTQGGLRRSILKYEKQIFSFEKKKIITHLGILYIFVTFQFFSFSKTFEENPVLSYKEFFANFFFRDNEMLNTELELRV